MYVGMTTHPHMLSAMDESARLVVVRLDQRRSCLSYMPSYDPAWLIMFPVQNE